MKTKILETLKDSSMSADDIARKLQAPREQILLGLFGLESGYQVFRDQMDIWHKIELSDPPPIMPTASYGGDL